MKPNPGKFKNTHAWKNTSFFIMIYMHCVPSYPGVEHLTMLCVLMFYGFDIGLHNFGMQILLVKH